MASAEAGSAAVLAAAAAVWFNGALTWALRFSRHWRSCCGRRISPPA
jgi:hypothetical protein